MGGLGMAEEAAERLPQQEGGQPRALGAGVDAPVDGGAHVVEVVGHGLGHGGGLGEGGGGVVQVDRAHTIVSY